MARDTVLIITGKDEISVPKVEKFLCNMDQRYFRLDTDSILDDSTKITMVLNEGQLNGNITLRDNSILSLNSIKSIWFRRPKFVATQSLNCDEITSQFIVKEFSAALRSLYTSLPEVYWMNHPVRSRQIFESNKLLQLKLAASSRLLTPKTMVTNNQSELLEFCKMNGGSIAVKPLHTSIFREGNDTSTAIYTTKVTYDFIKRRPIGVSLAPLIAQQYVEKAFELRITVAGKRILACKINSQESERTKVDWRKYDFDNVKHERFELPSNIKIKIHQFMDLCGLTFGAIDMIVTPNSEFVFLEINPAGQFGWIEELTKLPISESIAEALVTCE